MSVWVFTLGIIFRILVNGTHLIFPFIIERCSTNPSFHTLYIKLWHGILTYSMKIIIYSNNKIILFNSLYVWVSSHVLGIKIIRKSHQMLSNRSFLYMYLDLQMKLLESLLPMKTSSSFLVRSPAVKWDGLFWGLGVTFNHLCVRICLLWD